MISRNLEKRLSGTPVAVGIQHLRVFNDVVGGVRLRMRRVHGSAEQEFRNRQHHLVFIIGCGRSGTTILGRAFEKHHNVTYLNEPQNLWFGLDGRSDIWSPFAQLKRTTPTARGDDVTAEIKERFFTFLLDTAPRDGCVFVEKWPLNCFRVGYLGALDPQAKFIHLERDPISVAESIQHCVFKDHTWWGWRSQKWRALQRMARRSVEYAGLAELAVDDFDKGLLEWRMSYQEANRELGQTAFSGRVTHLRYEDFTSDPERQMDRVLRDLKMPPSESMTDFLRKEVRPDSSSQSEKRALTTKQKEILGPFAT